MARVLVTRPAEAAARTAALVRRLGHEPLLAPVMTIVSVTTTPPRVDRLQAILVTSRHAAQAAAALDGQAPLFAVGEGTAAALEECGVRPAAVAAGDGASLARLVADRLRPTAGALLHPTGEHRAGDLVRDLEAAGFAYQPWVVYTAAPAATLPPAAENALAAGTVDAVTLHSPRSARLLIALLRHAGLADAVRRVVALAISENVAAAARAVAWRAVRIAPRPDETGMAALLEELHH